MKNTIMNGSMSILGRTSNGRAIIAPTNSLSTVLDKATNKLVPILSYRDDDGKTLKSNINPTFAKMASEEFNYQLDGRIIKAQAIDLAHRKLKAERKANY